MVRKYLDSLPPVIDSVRCEADQEGVIATVRAHDNGSVGKASGIAEVHYSIGSAPEEADLLAWNWIPTIAEETRIILPDVSSGGHLNVRVADAAGNESVIESVQLADQLLPKRGPESH